LLVDFPTNLPSKLAIQQDFNTLVNSYLIFSKQPFSAPYFIFLTLT